MFQKEIVVATDFSSVSENAIHYACNMGIEMNMSVTLIHTYIVPVTFSETPMPIISLEETRDLSIKRLKKIADQFEATYPQLTIHAKLLYGEVTDALRDYEEEHHPSFIILGNSGAGDTSLWLGSNVSSLLKHLHTTVVAVPANTSYKKIESIYLSCDLKEISNQLPIDTLKWLQNVTGAQLQIIHVDDDGILENVEQQSGNQYLQEQLPDAQLHILVNSNIEEAVKQFVSHHEIDWLALVPKKHSFLYNLFHKSHTDGLLHIENVPIVALHV